ncbi:MAG: rRNA adenine N-6-methyltransferase family protein [Candidatus Woesearchaeota archaeon]
MKLDQHFLVNEDICRFIVSLCLIKEEDCVVEIGPGNGEITKFIPKCNLILIEKDSDLCFSLKKKFPFAKIINGEGVDELKNIDFDFLISSVPYSICEPLLWEILLHRFKKVILVLPQKFVNKISQNRSSLAFISNNLFIIKIVKKLKKEDFNPKPRVDSVVVVIERNKNSNKILEEVIFQSDKKLKNALREAIVKVNNKTKREAKAIIENIKKSVNGEVDSKIFDKELNKSVKKASLKTLIRITSIK